MKAIVYEKYGLPEVLQLKEVEKPSPKDDEVLIKVKAASVNSSDWEFLTGKPVYVRMWGLLKPKYKILGSDIAGRVESVGRKVKQFQPGDEVLGDIFAHGFGGFAEYVCAPVKALMLKPASITFEEAAAVPQAAVVALQALRDKGLDQEGQDSHTGKPTSRSGKKKVLINGAGGGQGTYSVQLAKLFGAEVTGVDSTRKLEMMRAIGADHVIDYTKEDFNKNGQQYDLILDFVARRSIFDTKRSLSSNGKYVLIGGSMTTIFQTAFIGPLISITSSKKMGILGHRQNKKDLAYMIELHEAGKVVPVIDRTYPLRDVSEALRYLGEGQAKGKVVITTEKNNNPDNS